MPHADTTYLIDDALWARTLTSEWASQWPGQSLQVFYGDMTGQTHVAELLVQSFREHSKVNGMNRFSLEFLGPVMPQLPSQTYRVRHAELGDFAVLLSAFGQRPEGVQYETHLSHIA